MDEAGQSILIVRNLTAGFATPAGTVVAVDNVSFDIKRNEALAIIGQSGSGKAFNMLGDSLRDSLDPKTRLQLVKHRSDPADEQAGA